MVCLKNLLILAVGATAAALPAVRRTTVSTTASVGLNVVGAELLNLTATVSLGSPNATDITISLDGLTFDLQAAIADVEALGEETAEVVAADAAKLLNFVETVIVVGVKDLVATLEDLKVLLLALGPIIVSSLKAFRAQLASYLITLASALPAVTGDINAIAVELDALLVQAIKDFSS